MNHEARDQAIVKDYAGGLTMEEVGSKWGLSRERVRQILNAMGHTERNTRKGPRVEFTCSGCGKVLWLRPSDIKKSRDRERKFCDGACRSRHQHTYSQQDLIRHMQKLAKELGRTPTQQDIQEHGPPSHTTFHARFGSMIAAQEAAGLEPNTHGGPR